MGWQKPAIYQRYLAEQEERRRLAFPPMAVAPQACLTNDRIMTDT
jgi:hypothetical protein